MPRQTVFYDIGATTNASGAATLRSNRLKPGQILCVQRVSLLSDDTDSVVCTVGLDRAGAFYPIETKVLTTHTYTYCLVNEIFVPSDCQLRVNVSAGGNTVPIHAYLYGYLQEL